MKAHHSSRILGRGERLVTILAIAAGLGLKLWLVWNLPLFGDEAFYWWESRYPAWGYSELPGLTPWTILLGTGIAGDSYPGVRWPFLLLGCALPVLVYRVARELMAHREAVLAGLASLALPLVAVQGVFAMPDVLLNAASLLLVLFAIRALRIPGWGWWMATGLVGALGLMTHFRFAVPAAALALALVSIPEGRRALKSPGPWLGLGVAVAGLVPTLIFNWRHDWASFSFQLVERHPWSFQPEGLAQPLIQAMFTTPGVFLLLIVAAVIIWRRSHDDSCWRVIAWLGLFPPLVYFLVGLVADQERVGFHWPLVGYLFLCLAVPAASARIGRGWATAALGLGGAVSLMAFAGLGWLATHPYQETRLGALFPDNALGWREVADMAGTPGDDAVVVADNFMVGAQLAFELGRSRVHVLDHPLNHKHGRAPQLRIWGLDERSIPDSENGVLVVEETALDLARRPAWAHHVCEVFPQARLRDEITLFGGRKRFRSFDLVGGGCDHPAFAYVDEPLPGATVPQRFTVSGWAFDDDKGVASVEIMLDGEPVREAVYGVPRPGVQGFFPVSHDPNHPKVGFVAEVGAPAGEYRLSLRVRSVDGNMRETPPFRIQVR